MIQPSIHRFDSRKDRIIDRRWRLFFNGVIFLGVLIVASAPFVAKVLP